MSHSSKTYAIKEIFYTLQGEGFHGGRPAVFCRFSGCNLWSGLEKDRSSAICQFCDTQFWGVDGKDGGKYTALALVEKINSLWPTEGGNKFVVCTGGEPALQLDKVFVQLLQKHNFEVAIETNGTLSIPENIDWVCMSPKADTTIKVTSGNEIKIVYPQPGINPKEFESLDFEHFYISPMDSPELVKNQEKCVQFVLDNPKWKLSLQTHKILGID